MIAYVHFLPPDEKKTQMVITQARPAYGYLRTSSAANVGDGKDSERRQQAAITGFAKAAGYRISGWYRDLAVSGTDPVRRAPRLCGDARGAGGRWRAHHHRGKP
jgi:hypothetical protein